MLSLWTQKEFFRLIFHADFKIQLHFYVARISFSVNIGVYVIVYTKISQPTKVRNC